MAIVVAKGGIVGRGRNELGEAGKQEGPTGRVLSIFLRDAFI